MQQKKTTTHRAPAHPAGNPSGSPRMFTAPGALIPLSGFSPFELRAAQRIGEVMGQGEMAKRDPALRRSLFMVGASSAKRLAGMGHPALEPIAERAGFSAVLVHLLAPNGPDFKTAFETAEALDLKPTTVREALSEVVSHFHQRGEYTKATHVWKHGIEQYDKATRVWKEGIHLLAEDKL